MSPSISQPTVSGISPSPSLLLSIRNHSTPTPSNSATPSSSAVCFLFFCHFTQVLSSVQPIPVCLVLIQRSAFRFSSQFPLDSERIPHPEDQGHFRIDERRSDGCKSYFLSPEAEMTRKIENCSCSGLYKLKTNVVLVKFQDFLVNYSFHLLSDLLQEYLLAFSP